MSALGKYLKKKRTFLNERFREFSIRGVAKRIGIHQSYLSRLERGEHAPLTSERILALARVLGEDPELLFALSGKLTERITNLISLQPEKFLQFVANLESDLHSDTSADSYVSRLENRKSELETLTRMLRQEINEKISLQYKLAEAQSDTMTILSNLKDVIIFCIDMDGNYIWKSNNLSKYEISHEDFYECGDVELEDCGKGIRVDLKGEVNDGEAEYRVTRDGKHWMTKSVPVRNAQGEVERVLHFGFDVSELFEAREALEKSESRWRFALEGAQEGVWDWNAQTNKVFFSRRWKEMLGYADDEIGDDLREWQSRIHPDDYDAVHEALAQHFGGTTPHYEFEHRLRCKDGTFKWILDRGMIVERTPGGAPLRAIGTHFDVTGRREAEETIRNNESFLKALVTSIKDGITVLDEDLTITFVNESQRARFSSRGPLEGRKCHEAFRGSSAPCEECPSLNCLKSRQSETVVIRSLSDFGWRDIELTCHPIIDAETGLVAGAVEVSRDITDRIEMENELRFEKNRYLSIFQQNPTVQLLIDPDTGRIMDCNEMACSFYQFERDELLRRNVSEVSTKAADSIRAELERAKKGEINIILSIHRLRDGNLREVEIRVAIISVEDTPLLHAIVIDVTERNQALRYAAEKREQLETLIENLPDLVCVKDPQGRLLAINRQGRELLGLQGPGWEGKTIEAVRGIVPRDHHDALSICDTRYVGIGSVDGRHRSRFQVRVADGGERIFDVLKVSPCHEDGSRAGMTVIARDITELCENDRRQALLAAIIDNSPNICVIKDLDLRVIATNQAFATAAGRQLEDLIGRTDAEIFGLSPDAYPVKGYMDDERLVQSFSRGQVLSRREEVVYHDGTVHAVQTRKFPVFDGDGNLIATANISMDMMEAVVARKKLADAEETCRLLVLRAPVGIYAVTEDGTYLHVNEAHAAMYGYASPEEMVRSVGSSREMFADAADRQRLLRLLERSDTVSGFECRMMRRDGREVWTSRTVRAIRDDAGKVSHYEAFVENIQARKEAERDAEIAHRLLLEVLQQLEAGVYVINPADRRVLFANRYLKAAVGKELVGRSAPQALLMNPGQCNFLVEDPAFSRSGATKSCELQFVNGKWYYCTGKRTSWIGGETAVVIVAVDMTQARLAAEMREDIDRIMRHDLRSPLNAIINIPQILAQSGSFNEQDRDMLLAIMDSGTKMLRLIDASLSLYRLETKTYVLDIGCVCVEDELRRAEKEMFLDSQEKKILKIIHNDREDKKTFINADLVTFPYLISNLMKNAFEANESKSDITVSISRRESLHVSFHNFGEVHESVRENFFGKYATYGKKRGTGLGTYSSKLIVEAHGGSISMLTSSSGGTQVSFIFPQSCLLEDIAECR